MAQQQTPLQQTALRKRDNHLIADHKMIEQAHVHKLEPGLQPRRDPHIRATRLGHPGRMIVHHDDGGSAIGERRAHNFTRMDARPIKGSPKERLKTNHLMARVEQQDREDLVLQIAQTQSQPAPQGLRVANHGTTHQRLDFSPPCNFRKCLQLTNPSGPDSTLFDEIRRHRREQAAKAAETMKQSSGEAHGAAAC